MKKTEIADDYLRVFLAAARGDPQQANWLWSIDSGNRNDWPGLCASLTLLILATDGDR
jgi:hypothetical protein